VPSALPRLFPNASYTDSPDWCVRARAAPRAHTHARTHGPPPVQVRLPRALWLGTRSSSATDPLYVTLGAAFNQAVLAAFGDPSAEEVRDLLLCLLALQCVALPTWDVTGARLQLGPVQRDGGARAPPPASLVPCPMPDPPLRPRAAQQRLLAYARGGQRGQLCCHGRGRPARDLPHAGLTMGGGHVTDVGAGAECLCVALATS